MPNINKVAPGAGAEWVLGGFALLRKAPVGLGLLGLGWGLLSLLALFSAGLNPTLGLLLQLAVALLGPFLFAGLVWAVREVDQGRTAQPEHLFQGLRSAQPMALLATLLPQLVSGLVLGILLLVLVGPGQLQQVVEVSQKLQEIAQAGGQPDPALVASLPLGSLFLWLLCMLAAVPVIVFFIFLAVPQILFSGRSGPEALGTSFRASLRNLPAMLVFLLLTFVAVFAILFVAQVLGMVAQLIAGPVFGLMAGQLALMAVLMPVLAGAVYRAWQQVLGGPQVQEVSQAPAQIEV